MIALAIAPTELEVQSGHTYMLPASLLSDEPIDEQDTGSLRSDASHDGVCYLYLLKALPDGSSYVAKVASHPENVARTGYTLIVTDEQLTLARLYQA